MAGKAQSRASKIERRRKNLSRAVLDLVFMEAGYMCANPRCRILLLLEAHHIVWVVDGGGDDASNLLALCPNCHAAHHKGNISHAAIRHWKAMLLALNHAFDRKSMELLLFLHNTEGKRVINYSGEGVLQFAGLIAAGLVEITRTEYDEDWGGEYMDYNEGKVLTGFIATIRHRLGLTDRGKLLVGAWLTGDARKYDDMVRQTSPA